LTFRNWMRFVRTTVPNVASPGVSSTRPLTPSVSLSLSERLSLSFRSSTPRLTTRSRAAAASSPGLTYARSSLSRSLKRVGRKSLNALLVSLANATAELARSR